MQSVQLRQSPAKAVPRAGPRGCASGGAGTRRERALSSGSVTVPWAGQSDAPYTVDNEALAEIFDFMKHYRRERRIAERRLKARQPGRARPGLTLTGPYWRAWSIPRPAQLRHVEGGPGHRTPPSSVRIEADRLFGRFPSE
jgi:hypothetical protein